ncbi:MAG TPA: thiamine pyrophosphate-binding protein [Pyrinomonadaceae bacterium]|jgi:indolepyruvate decarboxylase
MATMTVSNYLITRLKQAGLEHMFAVPGDYASPFLDALDAAKGIERIPNINELGSGYAADGYARYKGIGAACVQYGVGTFSLLNCTAGSFVERVPVAVISASPSTKDRAMEEAEEVLFHHSTGNLRADQIVFQNVTVDSVIIDNAETAPAQIDRAITLMLTHRKPVYIEVLNDVWSMSCAAPKGRLAPVVTPSDADSLAAALDATFERIDKAKLPILWAGVEIHRFGLQETLQQILDASGWYFTTTSLAKTVLDESQKQFIGTYAGPASVALTWDTMNASDCILALGTIITDDYLNIMNSSFGKMIEVNDQETRVGYQYYHDVTMKDFLEGILARVKANKRYPRKYTLPKSKPEEEYKAKPNDQLTYNIFYHELSNFLKKEKMLNDVALILGESTSLYVFGNLFGLPPNSFVAQAAWGSLGHETGCALGVALGSGKRPFVVAGDGGFRMVCQELSSMAYHKCNAVVFVMSNEVYAIEQAFVDIKAFTPKGSFAPFDILPSWDYLALAQSFGAKGFRAKTVEELRAVLSELNAIKDAPALVEIAIPQKDLAPQLKRLAETPPSLSKYRP